MTCTAPTTGTPTTTRRSTPAGSSPQTVWSADQAVKAWTAAGFPKTKLVLGVPFYGHLYSNVKGGGTGIHKPFRA